MFVNCFLSIFLNYQWSRYRLRGLNEMIQVQPYIGLSGVFVLNPSCFVYGNTWNPELGLVTYHLYQSLSFKLFTMLTI
jgi:hypothetical protein